MRRLVVRIATLLLAAWAIGLVVAATRLASWDDDLVRTLLQIRADTAFRINMAQRHEPISREWYHSKALALLKASEKLQDDSLWALFVPGAWRRFDDLRERVAARIEREFSEIAVETVRRELYWRTSQLTGVPQDETTGELAVADCKQPQPPASPDSGAPLNVAVQALPEYLAARDHIAAIAQLDGAVQAMVALQESRDVASADPDRLRLLVHYTLGAHLPGRLTRSAVLFSSGLKPWDAAQAALGLARLQQAVRCSLAQTMRALDKRVFERNDLLASEAELARRETHLLAPAGKQVAFDETVRSVRDVVAAIDAQQVVLSQGDYGWMYRGTPSLGPAHDALLAHVAKVRLLGPDTVLQLRRQSAGAMARFRTDFEAMFRRGAEPALVWHEETGQLVLSTQRIAWRDALVDLLQQPFMVPAGDAVWPVAAPMQLAWDAQKLDEALAIGEMRRRFTKESLPKFPHAMRAPIARLVDGQFARIAQERVAEAMITDGRAAAVPEGAAYASQRSQLARLEALLVSLGARTTAEKIHAMVSHDLVDRLALAEQDLWHSALYAPRTGSFDWWQGERAPQWTAFGAADGPGLRQAFAQLVATIDARATAVSAYLAHTDASAAPSPTVLRWQGIAAELRRYRTGKADSSLLALERYLLALGPDFSASNCAARLAASAPQGGNDDEIARRHLHIHQALAERCAQLRGGRWG
jgi:type VI secretion system protein ImpL